VELKIAFVSKPLFCEWKLAALLNREKAVKVVSGIGEAAALDVQRAKSRSTFLF